MVDDVLVVAKCGIDSIKVNAYVNARFEEKRLELNENKCVRVQTVKKSDFCPELQAHGENMKNVEETKYIGDIVHSNGRNTRNVESRYGVGMSVITSTIRILKEVSLGAHYFLTGTILRDSMLINSILLNVEVWFSMTKEEVEKFEKN